MQQIICITQKEVGDPESYPLCFFEDMEKAYKELKLIKETAFDNRNMKILNTSETRLAVKRQYPITDDLTVFIIEIEQLSLVEALNRMRFVKPAITPMDYLKRDEDV